MKSSTHSFLCVAILMLLIPVAYFLDRCVLAGAARTSMLMDGSWAWTKIISRLTISALLLGCAAFVLSPRRPSRTVGALYLLTGAVLTLMPLPSVAALLVFTPSAYVQLAVLQSTGIALPTTAAFLTVIGIGACLRSICACCAHQSVRRR